MGKPTGFLEYPRCDGAHRPPAERLQDYAEFLLPPDPEELHRQSARCMDCGVPYCHAGMMVAGSSIGCPLMNLIPETNDLVYRGELKAAYERMRKTNPFPEITGRVCPALCEGSCTLGEHDRPVTIQEIERYVADTARANGWDQDPIPDAGDTGRTVAVVGTGPAGLACADSLRRLGHRVTAFERADRPGGFLMYGIPMMKLEKTLVLEQVRRLEERGVVFRTGQDIGTDIDAGILLRDFDAAVLCTGARRERALTVRGRRAGRTHSGGIPHRGDQRPAGGRAPSHQRQRASGCGGWRRRHGSRLCGYLYPARSEKRCPVRDRRGTSPEEGARQSLAPLAQGIEAELCPGGGPCPLRQGYLPV